jgi:hypothetical protein
MRVWFTLVLPNVRSIVKDEWFLKNDGFTRINAFRSEIMPSFTNATATRVAASAERGAILLSSKNRKPPSIVNSTAYWMTGLECP